jgi:hypothetical protein
MDPGFRRDERFVGGAVLPIPLFVLSTPHGPTPQAQVLLFRG